METVEASPVAAAPSAPTMPSMPGGGMGGFDPSQLDPAWMMQLSQMMQRLPKGQLQKFQAIMRKAMAGKDVAQELSQLERTLPPQFQAFLRSSPMGTGVPATPATNPVNKSTEEMDEKAARGIIEQAVKEGRISKEQGENLLRQDQGEAAPPEAPSKFGKMWKGLFSGKKS